MNYLGGLGYAMVAVGVVGLASIVVFLVVGLPLLRKIVERASNSVFTPSDLNFRVVPEYSLAEARVKQGKYADAVDEYRQVIVKHPTDVQPHLRIADLALTHLNDVKLAESELLAAVAKAEGEDTAAIASGRLADFYQFTLQQPQRALEVMEQLGATFKDSKRAMLAGERIHRLRELVARGETVKIPAKIAPRTADEETLRRRRGY